MSSKNSENKLVGQPIFKQLIDLIPKNKVDYLVHKSGTGLYYKEFKSWDQLLTMLFGALSRCDSMGEVCDGMMSMQGKLNHLGLNNYPAKSAAGMD